MHGITNSFGYYSQQNHFLRIIYKEKVLKVDGLFKGIAMAGAIIIYWATVYYTLVSSEQSLTILITAEKNMFRWIDLMSSFSLLDI